MFAFAAVIWRSLSRIWASYFCWAVATRASAALMASSLDCATAGMEIAAMSAAMMEMVFFIVL